MYPGGVGAIIFNDVVTWIGCQLMRSITIILIKDNFTTHFTDNLLAIMTLFCDDLISFFNKNIPTF